jgi:hypothetical protein
MGRVCPILGLGSTLVLRRLSLPPPAKTLSMASYASSCVRWV